MYRAVAASRDACQRLPLESPVGPPHLRKLTLKLVGAWFWQVMSSQQFPTPAMEVSDLHAIADSFFMEHLA